MKSYFTKYLFSAMAAIMLVAGCKTTFDVLMESGSDDEVFEAAFDYFNAGKYSRSAQLFEKLSLTSSGSSRADTVLYYLGMSYYLSGDIYTAETHFKEFGTFYARSAFSEEVNFLRLDCLYRQTYRYELDQTPTYSAITAISEYMIDFPQSPYFDSCISMLKDLNERLDRKALENAKLYYNMEDYRAARVAFRNILKDDADNIYREEILYYTSLSSYKYAELSVASKQRERFLAFIDDYLNFVGEFPESKYRKEMDGLYKKAQRVTGKNVEPEE